MKAAFIYSNDFSRFSYGSSHPLKPFRLKLTYELIKACGLLASDDPRLIVPAPAKREDLLAFHSAKYINMLEASNSGKELTGAAAYGLGYGDNPVFPGMFDWSLLVAGASLLAADLVDSGEAGIAFNIQRRPAPCAGKPGLGVLLY
jgi:acetoin utilization protein AcuC